MLVFRCFLLFLVVCLQGNYCKPAHDEQSEDRGYISTFWNWIMYFVPWGSAADAKETSFNSNESKNSSLLKNKAVPKARMLTAVTRNIDLTTEKHASEMYSLTSRSAHDHQADVPQDSQEAQIEPLTAKTSAAENFPRAEAVSTATTPILAVTSAKNNLEKMGEPVTTFSSEPKASITLIPRNIDNLPTQNDLKIIEEPTEEQTFNSEMSTTPIALINDYWTTKEYELDFVARITSFATTLDIVTEQANPVVEFAEELELSKDAANNDIVLMTSTRTDDESASTELTPKESTGTDEIMKLKKQLGFIEEKEAMYSYVDDVSTTTELDTGLSVDLMPLSNQPSLSTFTEEDATSTSTNTALNLFTNINIDGDLILKEPALRLLKRINKATVQTPLFSYKVDISNLMSAEIDEDIISTESTTDLNIVGEDTVLPKNEQDESIPNAVDPTTEAFIELEEFSTIFNAAPKQTVIADEEKILVPPQFTGLKESLSIKVSAEAVFTEVHETIFSEKNLTAFTELGDTLITKEPDANPSTRIKEGLILTKNEPNAVPIEVNGTKTTKLDELVSLPTKPTTYYFSNMDRLVLTKLDLLKVVEEKSDKADEMRIDKSTSDTSAEVVEELTSGVTETFVASLDSVTGGTTHSAGFQLKFDYSCLCLLFIKFLKPLLV